MNKFVSSLSVAILGLIGAFLSGCSCSSITSHLPSFKTDLSSHERNPGSEYIAELNPDLLKNSQDLLNYVSSPAFDPSDCMGLVREGYAHLFRVEPDYFDRGILDLHAQEIVQNFFKSRIAIRHKIGEWSQANQIPESCFLSLRTGMRAIRVLEDFVLQYSYKYPNRDLKDKIPAYEIPDYFLQNPAFPGALELKSGDVLLSRGTAVTSAAIARITEVDANFSHLAIVYIPKEDQNKPYDKQSKFVVEAHIEVGSVVSTLEQYRTDGKARAVVFRQPDAELAHQAARFVYETVKKREDDGKNIDYDFGMDLAETKRLFCSEVVSYAYNEGTKGKFKMPFFSSRLDGKNKDLLDRLGVTAITTFAPADIELDPRFELVAEWRDVGRIQSVIEMDAVLTAMFDWMGNHDYKIHEPKKDTLISSLVWTGRRFPLFSGLLKEKFPKNMKRKTLATVMVLDKLGAYMIEKLKAANEEYFKQKGHKMPPRLLHEELEKLRLADLEIYKAKGKSPIHTLLRP